MKKNNKMTTYVWAISQYYVRTYRALCRLLVRPREAPLLQKVCKITFVTSDVHNAVTQVCQESHGTEGRTPVVSKATVVKEWYALYIFGFSNKPCHL